MDYLANHAEITNSTARQLTGIGSENTMKEVFYRLAKRALIERVPGRLGASSAWQKLSTAQNLDHLSPAQERLLKKLKARLVLAEKGERDGDGEPYTADEQAAAIADIKRRITLLLEP